MVKRVAVTGAAGLVGRGVLELFSSRGCRVVAVDTAPPPPDRSPEGVTWAQVDMADYDAVVEAFNGCDGLVHLAAIPFPGRLPDHVVHANNVVSSYNALRAAAEVGIKNICQASSVNAIGVAWSRAPHFDYFPLDEAHPTYAEDPYSLSKWVCEQQADAIVRRFAPISIASLRFHMVVPDRETAAGMYASWSEGPGAKNLWGYVSLASVAGACWLSLECDLHGHEAFHIVAPDTAVASPSEELAKRHYPAVGRRHPLSENESFFDSSKAGQLLGWRHEDW